MASPRLDWSTAEVKGATLTVALDGKAPSGWKGSFAATVRLLGGGEWGEVAFKKRTVRVTDVVEGEEEKLRHFLDSVVEQANASAPSEPDQSESETDAESDEAEGPDAEMTKRFRSFAEPTRDAGEDPGSGRQS
ncbi:MAG: hypothetical protein ACRDNK_15020 [Solirubrobacteraceae bacterium]